MLDELGLEDGGKICTNFHKYKQSVPALCKNSLKETIGFRNLSTPQEKDDLKFCNYCIPCRRS